MVRAAARRTAGLLAGAGLLLLAGPGALALPRAQPADDPAALRLLEEAARASRTLHYAGTKYVATWRSSGATAALVDVDHHPGRGTVVTASPGAAPAEDRGGDALLVGAARLDDGLLDVLARRYELRLAGDGRCTGRPARIVEARRGDGMTVAGRFWVDAETGLLLRREVYDEAGARLGSSAFVDLELEPRVSNVPRAAAAHDAAADLGERVPASRLPTMRDAGWPVPDELPGGFVLHELRRRSHGDGDGARVVHAAYSDGLSTTSLFVQSGSAGERPPEGFAARDLGGHRVWVHDGAPERVVWSGGGKVWTLVSDAPDGAVSAAVAALPHDRPEDGGVRARLGRGLSRVGSWLNPFG